MAKFFATLTEAHCRFIERQKIFFTGTAPQHGRVNISPKGMNTFRVLGASRIAYLDVTGSGNETAAHLGENGRVTVMFCAFEGDPMIMRLYGRGRTVQRDADEWRQLRPLFGSTLPGERQIIVIEIESGQSSCGFAVPFFDYREDREQLNEWATRKGQEGLAAYHAEKNVRSIDGLPTGLSLAADRTA